MLRTLGHRQCSDHERHQCERHQQPEDPSPTQRLGQQAAHQRDPLHCPNPRCRRPSRSRTRPARTAGKAFVRTLTDTGKISSAAPRPCTARKAMTKEPPDDAMAHNAEAKPEYRDACQAAPYGVRICPHPARRNHECAKCQHVDADHPLQIRGVAAEVRCHPRQRQVHREVVDLDAEQRGRHRRQDPPGPHRVAGRTHPPTIRPATVGPADLGFCD